MVKCENWFKALVDVWEHATQAENFDFLEVEFDGKLGPNSYSMQLATFFLSYATVLLESLTALLEYLDVP